MFGRKQQTACERIREKFSPYIDGIGTTVDRDAVEFHIEICDSCRHELASLKQTTELLHQMPAVRAPRSFTLAEAPARGFTLPFGVPSVNYLRAATAVASVVLLVMATFSVTGTLNKTGGTTVSEATTPAATDEVIPVMLDEENPVLEEGSGTIEDYELAPPTPGSTGLAGLDDPDKAIPESTGKEPHPWDYQQQEVDPGNGAGEVESPTPPPHAPSWLQPVTIVSAILVLTLVGMNLFIWQRKRRFVSLREG